MFPPAALVFLLNFNSQKLCLTISASHKIPVAVRVGLGRNKSSVSPGGEMGTPVSLQMDSLVAKAKKKNLFLLMFPEIEEERCQEGRKKIDWIRVPLEKKLCRLP